ncbi:MAG: winged helix-turn-helix domain-containing protein [Bryobacteraceae bacterium]
MLPELSELYEFGSLRADPARRLLLSHDAEVPITPKAFDTLLILLRNPGRVLDKEELINAIWPDSLAGEANLANSISQLRKALARSSETSFIVTVPGRGYQFTEPVRVMARASQTAAEVAFVTRENGTATLNTTARRVRSRTVRAAAFIAVLVSVGAIVYLGLIGSITTYPGLTLAVAPFRNLSGDAELDRFRDEVMEELSLRLAGEPGIVMNTFSRRAQANAGAVDQTISRLKGGVASLEGSLWRSAAGIRIAVRLTSPDTQRQIWSQTYDVNPSITADADDQVVRAIARTIGSRFGGLSPEQLSQPPTRNHAALGWYVKAREQWDTQRRPGLIRSVEYYRNALREDPRYAEAHAGLAASELFLESIEGPAQGRLARTKSEAERAIALDDRLFDAHALLGNIYLNHEADSAAAERELKRALVLQPGHSPYEYWYAQAAILNGHFTDALEELEIGRMVNPGSDTIRMATALVYLAMRQPEEAERWARQAVELGPGDVFNRRVLGLALEQRGKYAEAIEEFRVCAERPRDWGDCVPALGHALAVSGHTADARRILRALEERPETGTPALALLYVGLGEYARAVAVLKKEVGNRDPRFAWVKLDARFDPLRKGGEWTKLVAARPFLTQSTTEP